MLRVNIAEQSGTDPDAHMYPVLVAAATLAAITAAYEHWLRAGTPDALLPRFLIDAFAIVDAGYPIPRTD